MSMTLEEAIIHAEEVADRCEVTDGDRPCAEQHRQLAEWLKELAERRKQPEIIRCGNCRFNIPLGDLIFCKKWSRYTVHTGYCHQGAERRTDD